MFVVGDRDMVEGVTNTRAPGRLVCVTGPDGSGKSTLVAGLVDRLRGETGAGVRVVSIWDLLARPDIRASFPVDPSRVDAYLASLGGHARAHFLLHCLAEATAQAVSSGAPWLLLDGYWYKYLAIEIAHGAAEADVTALTARFPEPALVLYLDAPAAAAVARKTRFSRYESGLAATPDAATFSAFQAKVRPVLERWAERRGWVRIDGAAEPGVVLESAWRAVRGHVARTKREVRE
jgi:thymidylate kinase